MSNDKDRFSVRVQAETKETIDEYRDNRGLNRSQAVEQITEQWADLTDGGEIHPELVKARGEEINGRVDKILRTLQSDKEFYLVASIFVYLVFETAALPMSVNGLLLVISGVFSFLSLVGHLKSLMDLVTLDDKTASEIEVEA